MRAQSPCLGLGLHFSCAGFGTNVKMRLNLHKKCEVSGKSSYCLILQKEGGNCTLSSGCKIAATDNQNGIDVLDFG